MKRLNEQEKKIIDIYEKLSPPYRQEIFDFVNWIWISKVKTTKQNNNQANKRIRATLKEGLHIGVKEEFTRSEIYEDIN